MKALSVLIFMGNLVLVSSGCYYDVEEELYPSLTCETEGVTYSGDILEIIQANCYECHDDVTRFGNIDLEGYGEVKSQVDNGNLLGVIQHESGFSPMPKNKAQLLECEIEKVMAWIDQGAPNN